MIRSLSSIRLTFILLILITFLMGAGIILCLSGDYRATIRLMSETIVYSFLKENWQNNLLLSFWVASICLASALLFLNTALCSITRQLKTALKIPTLRKWSFLIIHIAFLIVLACHGITMVTGSKITGIRLFEGESFSFDETLEIHVSEISFGDNIQILKLGPKKSRELMTRRLFHREKNFARISLFENGKKLAEKNVYMLNPLQYKSTRITLTKFILKEKQKKAAVGVDLTLSENIFTQFFLVVYAVMIVTLICFIAITWNPKKTREENLNGS